MIKLELSVDKAIKINEQIDSLLEIAKEQYENRDDPFNSSMFLRDDFPDVFSFIQVLQKLIHTQDGKTS